METDSETRWKQDGNERPAFKMESPAAICQGLFYHLSKKIKRFWLLFEANA